MFANVALPVPLRTLFTYKIPKTIVDLSEGTRVLVPFGKKRCLGFCVETTANAPEEKEIKDIIAVIPQPQLFSKPYWQWLKNAADYYVTPLGQILAQAVPSYYFDVEALKASSPPKSHELSFDLGFHTRDVTLTTEQEKIYDTVKKNFSEFYPLLLHGITGSGKTEIYIKLIKLCLERQGAALLLVPEIGLTPQMLSRLNHHFKDNLLVYHSGLSVNQRLTQWNRCLANRPLVMVGTRSALFAPFPNLGLIVVDEEHDASYKQEDRFRYHARDLAVMRARQLSCPIVLGSATPSLESYYLADTGKYHLATLSDRVGGAKLPRLKAVDFRLEKEQRDLPRLLSKSLHDAIDRHHAHGKQVILFVGMRGFAQNAYCLHCARIELCLNCSVGLTYHKTTHMLKCHYCGLQRAYDEICPTCHDKVLTLLGFGTQSIEEEVKTWHPRCQVSRVDSDVAGTAKKVQALFSDFAARKIDLLVGTQMLSKGHDFSHVGLVGIVGADAHLGLPDFRAAERSVQNIVQVAGRAGRSTTHGEVIVQSLLPDHPVMQFALKQDYKSFAQWELKNRQALIYPPFGRLIQIRFLAADQTSLTRFLQEWQIFLQQAQKGFATQDLRILGPVEMPIAKLRGKYRHHVLIKVRRGLKFQDFLAYVLHDLEKRDPQKIQYQIDVDVIHLI